MAESDLSARVAREVFLSSIAGDTGGLAWVLPRLAGIMQDVFLDAGDVVYRRGDAPQDHYFVASGQVTLRRPGANDWTLGPRSALGTIDIVLDRPRERTAITTAPTHLLKMPAEQWLDLLEDSSDLARRVVTRLSAGVHALRLRPPPLGGFDEVPARSAEPPANLSLVDRILLLHEVGLLGRAGVQTLARLAELGHELRAAGGDVLFARGDMRGRLVIVAAGEVIAARQEPELRGRFGRGSAVGGASALDDLSAYEVRAVGSAAALSIALEDYFDVMEEHFGLARSALMAAAEEREKLLDRPTPGATVLDEPIPAA
jgi:CRP-like cAMP-binding protein